MEHVEHFGPALAGHPALQLLAVGWGELAVLGFVLAALAVFAVILVVRRR